MGERYNLLPIAFSQNEDGDLKKLRAFLMQKKTPVSAVVNLMPFRLGAGPMGGDADQAVEILKELDVPYFKPFCLTRVSGGGMGAGGCRESGEFLISILLPELDGGILTFPVGVMGSGSTEGRRICLSTAGTHSGAGRYLCGAPFPDAGT
ncbi:MAG: cobaltochelatase subunit CobN [Blautia massiliensis (ex Durand et al. 2017)]|uniref:cobaltochelatase subunit CobN n=1 Tax=Blautia massiliensis (ex Durand et al. 2017) TaxID=1737424 RepID=UPI00399C7ECA